jgi:hypothetical protein
MTLEYLIHHLITLKPHHRPTGNTRHPSGTISDEGELIRRPELLQPHALMIAQLLPDPGYLLLYLDEDGEEITDTYHESLEKALDQANWEFNIEPNEWDPPASASLDVREI